jgi:hypothetical protein
MATCLCVMVGNAAEAERVFSMQNRMYYCSQCASSDICGRFSSAVTDYSQHSGIITFELLVHEVVPWFHMANIGCHKQNFKFGHPSCKSSLRLRPWVVVMVVVIVVTTVNW